MAETSVRGAVLRESSAGDRPNRAKRNRTHPPMSPRDLISDLPDAVIHRIFSFLPLRDVVKTSVLSKRWRSTWTTTTHLVFYDFRPRHREPYYPDFPSLVDSVLSRCTSPAVKRFHITIFKCDEAYRPKLDLWLRFAEERRVEDLRLCLYQRKVHYKLPRFLYCLTRLVRLQVWGCCISLGTAVRWPCLKVLSLGCAELSDDILEGIVRGSPVLESLALRYCRGVKNIIIHSTSVKRLTVVEDRFSNLEKIWAPHLLSLRVSGFWRLHSMFRLDDISSLVETELDFAVSGDRIGCRDLSKELLEKLRGVSTITIGHWCLQGSHVQLKLDKESIERFNEDLLSQKGNFQCLAKHLKRVEIIGFASSFGSKLLLALIKFLLGDALTLEKMIIKADFPAQRGQKHLEAADLSKLLGVSRNVLSHRRASQNAEVIFDYPLEELSLKNHMKKIRVSELGRALHCSF